MCSCLVIAFPFGLHFGLFVPVGASYLASLPATPRHTFGLKRTESLAALFSMLTLAFVCLVLACEAIKRLASPVDKYPVEGSLMSGIAAIGVVVNLSLAYVLGDGHHHLPGHDHSHDHFHHEDLSTKENGTPTNDYGATSTNHHLDHHHHHHHDDESDENDDHDHSDDHSDDHEHDHGHDHEHDHDHEHNLQLPQGTDDEEGYSEFDALIQKTDDDHHKQQQHNVNLRAAYIHVMADLAQSVAVLVAGLVIWYNPDWHVVDPICTLGYCMIVFYSTIGVLKSSVSVLLEETPSGVSWQEVHNAIRALPNVYNVHDLHIWSISHGKSAMSVHCNSPDPRAAMANICAVCKQHGIDHPTIQILQSNDAQDADCVTCDGVGCIPGDFASGC